MLVIKKNYTVNFLHIVLLIFIFILSGCEEKTTNKARSARPVPTVEIAQAEVLSLNHSITITGTLQARKTIHFYNQAQGLLLELPFYEGDSVEQGQILARLDDTIIRAEYDKAIATLKQSRIDYNRLKKLAPSNLTSKELLTRAQTKVVLDEAEYNLQKKRLSYTKIKAPWSGIISERLVEPGDVLPLHTHFMSFIDTSSLIVKIPLSELSLNKVKPGDSINFVIDALGKKSWSGNILRIHPQINAETRKGIIEVKLDPVPDGARPGQLARIKLTTPKEQILVIPLPAIRYDQQGAYVFTINKESKIKRTKIITGQKYPRYMEVLQGLKAGDTIVKKGLFGLSSGKKVKVLGKNDSI